MPNILCTCKVHVVLKDRKQLHSPELWLRPLTPWRCSPWYIWLPPSCLLRSLHWGTEIKWPLYKLTSLTPTCWDNYDPTASSKNVPALSDRRRKFPHCGSRKYLISAWTRCRQQIIFTSCVCSKMICILFYYVWLSGHEFHSNDLRTCVVWLYCFVWFCVFAVLFWCRLCFLCFPASVIVSPVPRYLVYLDPARSSCSLSFFCIWPTFIPELWISNLPD